MSKTVSKFALAASVALAMAFTFSCSSDDDNKEDNPGGGGSPAIPPTTNANGDQTYGVSGKQVYILGLPSRPYEGSTALVGYNCGATGSIANGKLSLNLPSIDSFNDDYDNEQGSCKEGFNVDIEDFPPLYLQLYGTTKGLTQITEKADVKAVAVLVYALRKGARLEGMNLNLEKGWNIVYNDRTTGKFTLSTVPPSGLTWEWGLNED